MSGIKFRIWDTTYKRMIAEPRLFFLDHKGFYWQIKADGGMRSDLEANLMQCTGLKDKNGREVYEGDIVCRYGKHLSVVAWNADFCGFTPLCEYRDKYGKPNAEESSQVTEVIGNIYEHPHLLQEAQS